MDFRTFVRTIAFRWKIVLAATLACLLGATAYTAIQPKRFEASTTILLSYIGAKSISDAYEATYAAQNRLSSYAEIAGGRTVAERAIAELGLSMSPDALVSSTNVTYTPDSTLFRLTVTNSDPQLAAELAKAMSEQFAALLAEVDVGFNVPAGEGDASAETDGQTTSARALATVVDSPVAADTGGRSLIENLALGLAIGFALGVALALARNATDPTIRTADALSKVSGTPPLALLPRTGKRRRRGRVLTNMVFEEQVRSLRNRLVGGAEGECRSILLSAPIGGQGATTAAVNLALSFTEIDQSVLLVEGDVRQTTITDLLDVDSRLGLADVLADPRGLYDAIAPSGHAGMWVLGANVPAQPRHHLTTAQLDEMMQKLYGHFDRIVVLGPPALVAAESAILASVVDATVLVVSAGKATTDDVEGARENLESVGGHVVGVVLTDLPVPRRTRAAAAAYRDRVSEPGSLVLRANRP